MGPFLEQSLGGVDEFLALYYCRRPCHRAGARARELPLMSLEDVEQTMTDRLLRYPDLRLIRDGGVIDVRRYTKLESAGGGPARLVPEREAVLLEYQRGATILLQDANRYFSPLRALCREAVELFGFSAACNVLVTPAGGSALPVHVDLYDSLVFQSVGNKHWQVFEPSVPNPIRGKTKRAADRARGQLALSANLEPGDFLYVPRGFPHAAVAANSASVHVTLSVYGTSWIELVSTLLVERMAEDPEFREWVPAGRVARAQGSGAESVSRLQALVRRFLEVDPSTLAEWIDAARAPTVVAAPAGRLAQLSELDELTDETLLSRRPGTKHRLMDVAGEIVLELEDRTLTFPAWTQPAVERVARARSFRLGDLSDVLDAHSRKVLARRLLREGLLAIDRGAERRPTGSHTEHDSNRSHESKHEKGRRYGRQEEDQRRNDSRAG